MSLTLYVHVIDKNFRAAQCTALVGTDIRESVICINAWRCQIHRIISRLALAHAHRAHSRNALPMHHIGAFATRGVISRLEDRFVDNTVVAAQTGSRETGSMCRGESLDCCLVPLPVSLDAFVLGVENLRRESGKSESSCSATGTRTLCDRLHGVLPART